MDKKKIGVLGAGTWGMALSRMLCNSGHDVTVWSALPQEVETFAKDRKHPNLPGMTIPREIVFTGDIQEVCSNRDILLFAVPSVFVRSTAKAAAPFIRDGQIMVDVAKGLEKDTFATMTQIIGEEIRRDGKHDNVKIAALSGPTHAEEVALDMPTTIVAACEDENTACFVQDVFMNTCLRVYTNPDVHGVELCGALKNVIALAAGISDGIGYGDNAKAALITRGMVEIKRIGCAMGCQPATFDGLAGIGDLIVTATSRHSRNNRCGNLIGQGMSRDEAVKTVGMVVEGLNALPAALALAEKYQVEMLIVNAVDAIVNQGADAKQVVLSLLTREKKAE